MDKKKLYIAPKECEASAVDFDINALSCSNGESEDKEPSGGGTTGPVNPWDGEDDDA